MGGYGHEERHVFESLVVTPPITPAAAKGLRSVRLVAFACA